MTIFRKRPVQMLSTQDPQVIPGGALTDRYSNGGALSGVSPGANLNINTSMGVKAQGLPDAPSFGDYAKLGVQALSGFGGGPMSMVGAIGGAIMDPSSLTDTRQVNIPGIGNVATAPGGFGPILDASGFGTLARAMGALNARNLASIMANDPNAVGVSGRGVKGAVSGGTYSGNTPAGLSGMERETWKRDIARQARDTRDNRRNDMGGRSSVDNSPDDRDN